MKKDKPTWKELWNNKRTHAAIVLGIWLIFIFGLIIFMYIADALSPKVPIQSNQPSSSTKTFKDFSDMKTELLENNYAYTYEINQNGNHIVFKGSKKGTKEAGYKETNQEIIKYEKDETGIYQVTLNEKIAIDTLYEGLNETFLNVPVLLGKISFVSKEETTNQTYKQYTYHMEEEGIAYTITITMDQDAITKMLIDHPEGMYTLKFQKIGQITDADVTANN